jgi:DNA-binding response OmpR family regulator
MKGNVVRMSDRAKLLVVDDEPERCEMLTEYFDTQGFVTRAVGSVSEARQFLERWIPNLAILD